MSRFKMLIKKKKEGKSIIMGLTNRINAIIMDVKISPPTFKWLESVSIFGFEIRSRFYTFEEAQRFINRTKLYDLGLLLDT